MLSVIQKIFTAFGVNQVAPYIRAIPQTTTTLGAASFNLGFPAATMTDVEDGGTPPSGADMNGILAAVSGYCAAIQAGEFIGYDAATSTALGGYPLGAVLQQASNPFAFWINAVAANTSDPDTGGAGWLSTVPLLYSFAGTPGNNNDFVLPGYSDYFLDVNPSGGNVTFTGFVARRDGQRLTITTIGSSNTVTVANQNTASAAANRIRAIADIGLGVLNASVTIQYVAALSRWTQV